MRDVRPGAHGQLAPELDPAAAPVVAVAMVAVGRPEGYPERYRKCPVCMAELGAPCRSRSGTIVEGRPDQIVLPLDRPHIARKLRK